jgi:hypothetical protein
MPIELDVVDTTGRLHRFAGNFGRVIGWCFASSPDAVVYRYQYPHGMTPVGFDMRRLKDGRLLKRILFDAVGPDEDQDDVVQRTAPTWTSCAQSGRGER